NDSPGPAPDRDLGSGATVAQLTLDQKVEGSNPSSPATSPLTVSARCNRTFASRADAEDLVGGSGYGRAGELRSHGHRGLESELKRTFNTSRESKPDRLDDCDPLPAGTRSRTPWDHFRSDPRSESGERSDYRPDSFTEHVGSTRGLYKWLRGPCGSPTGTGDSAERPAAGNGGPQDRSIQGVRPGAWHHDLHSERPRSDQTTCLPMDRRPELSDSGSADGCRNGGGFN